MTRPTIADLIDATAELTYTSRADITGSRRFRPISNARKVVYVLARRYGYSTILIAARLGGLDHSSVTKGCIAAENLMVRFPDFAQRVIDVENLAVSKASERASSVTAFLPVGLRIAA